MRSLKNRLNETLKINEANTDIKSVETAIKNAENLMGVGAELKKLGIKYDFTTNDAPMPPAMYTFNIGKDKYAILSKKYVDGADFLHGDIAMGQL